MAAIVTSLGLKTALVLVTAGSLHATVTPPRAIGEVQQYTDDKGEKAFVGTAVAVKVRVGLLIVFIIPNR